MPACRCHHSPFRSEFSLRVLLPIQSCHLILVRSPGHQVHFINYNSHGEGLRISILFIPGGVHYVSSVVSNSPTPWTVAHQALLSMGFSRQEYWSGLPCPPPGDLPNPASNQHLLSLLHFFTISATWEAPRAYRCSIKINYHDEVSPHSLRGRAHIPVPNSSL